MRIVLVSAGLGLAVALATAGTAVAKPAPGQSHAQAGHIVTSNLGAKAGIPAAPAIAIGGKAAPTGVGPNVRGYTVVNSGNLANPNGVQSFGSVGCPTGTVAFGGGVFGNSTSIFQNVNGSIPIVSGSVAVGWEGWVDNTSGSDSSFSIYAVCAHKPSAYAVVSLGFTAAASSQTIGVTVQCPLNARGKRLKVLGGGAVGGATTPGEDINSSFPIGGTTRAWRTDMNNNFSTNQSAAVYAVCGGGKNWTVVPGAAVANPAGAQTRADASCPSGLTAVGGGELSGSSSTLVNLNATFPASASAWGNYENNASGSNTTVTPFVVCIL